MDTPRQRDTGFTSTLGDDILLSPPSSIGTVWFGSVWVSLHDQALPVGACPALSGFGYCRRYGFGETVLLIHDLTTNISYYNLFGVSVSFCDVIFFWCFVFICFVCACLCPLSCSFYL
jgi:hypothetical protein